MNRAWHLYHADRRRWISRRVGIVMRLAGKTEHPRSAKMLVEYQWEMVGDARVRPGHVGRRVSPNGLVYFDLDVVP